MKKTRITTYLLEPAHEVRIFPHKDYVLSRAEHAVLQTSPVQRLRGLRQIGLGVLIWPTAEHSRLAHSLGTAYWATHFLKKLRSNTFSKKVGDGHAPEGNKQRLEEMDHWLGPELSLELCIRLFALVHDMTLLPLGHTLQYQLGFYKNAKVNNRRSEICLQQIRKEIPEALRVACPCWSESHSELQGMLSRHLDVVEELFRFRHPKNLSSKKVLSLSQTSGSLSQVRQTFPFILDLITSTFSADLVDFASRDSLGAGWPRSYNEKIGRAFCVFRISGNSPPGKSHKPFTYRFGLNPLGQTYQHDVVNGVIALQRVRYELAARLFYHDRKLIADAMLDSVLRFVESESGALGHEKPPFDQVALLKMGDDELLRVLEDQEHRVFKKTKSRPPIPQSAFTPIMPQLLAGRFFIEAFRVTSPSTLSTQGRRFAERATQPPVRTSIEHKILKRIPELQEGDVIFSGRPFTMQAKDSSVLIGWKDGRPYSLMDLAEKFKYATEVLDLFKQYETLWSLSVYLRPEMTDVQPKVAQVCRNLFLKKD